MAEQGGDPRLWGQELHLQGVTFHWSRYTQPSPTWDHDHCEFCFQRFAEAQAGYTDAQHCGYTTEDRFNWICKKCFEDFKDRLNWIIGPSDVVADS